MPLPGRPCHRFGPDALWQLVGFNQAGVAILVRRALGVGELKFTGQILPTAKKVVYRITMVLLFNGHYRALLTAPSKWTARSSTLPKTSKLAYLSQLTTFNRYLNRQLFYASRSRNRHGHPVLHRHRFRNGSACNITSASRPTPNTRARHAQPNLWSLALDTDRIDRKMRLWVTPPHSLI